jgi:hypothetical protein
MVKHLTFIAGCATPKMTLDALWGIGVYGSRFFVNRSFYWHKKSPGRRPPAFSTRMVI